jgi:hypothetical protein
MMRSAAFQAHKSWLVPAASILVVTGLIYGVVGSIVGKPSPWIILVPGSLPLSMYFFVARPPIRKGAQDS